MIEIESVVRLASKARLRFDRHSQRHMLLYPEHGLVLSQTAADVVTLLAESRRVAAIVDQIVEKYGEENRDAISGDVLELLRDLEGRGLLREVLP